MLSNKIIILLILLAIPVNADQLIIIDTTGNYEEIAYVFVDNEYVRQLNMSGTENNITFGVNNYTIVINPTYQSIISSPNNPDFISYWWNNLRYYFFGLIFIIIFGVITWNIYRKY